MTMMFGGNNRAHLFFKEHGCPVDDKVRFESKYTSRAANSYRRILAKEVAEAMAEEATTGPPSSPVLVEESDAARRLFSKEKSISSAQFFGDPHESSHLEPKTRLEKLTTLASTIFGDSTTFPKKQSIPPVFYALRRDVTDLMQILYSEDVDNAHAMPYLTRLGLINHLRDRLTTASNGVKVWDKDKKKLVWDEDKKLVRMISALERDLWILLLESVGPCPDLQDYIVHA
ncbi:unnamed protein product [Microthlaspi erraticum]|uniref:Uncharacterized protein n=1 Tax=Microthlaspi erraticum TaxID=1685480 RepID=A0A6D2J830_9BRAS|nr:unnamed protein product [Microthlaspi erraticum]